jgi:hypothetical protein
MKESPLPQDVLEQLTANDDVALWRAAWAEIVTPIEASATATANARRVGLYVQIGACSHWLRPHQTRLTVAGGFAWPSGYGGGGSSRLGLPEFDWAAVLRWQDDSASWVRVDRFSGKRRVVCRIAVPTRTARHNQAVVHVRWEPGTLTLPRHKTTHYHAFRRRRGGWECAASGDLNTYGAA